MKFLLAEVKGGSRSGELLVVVDRIGAGIGDRVIVVTGSAARRMMGNDAIPVDAAVVGIVDENYDEIKRQNGEVQRFS